MKRPMTNTKPGAKYARQGRRRHTSGPTIASASRQRPRTRKPVANIQWTCSAGGCIGLLRSEVLDEPGRDAEREEDPDEHDPERRLDEEPPEALSARVEQRDPVRLDEGPREPGHDREWAERRDGARAGRAVGRACLQLTC